MKNGLSLVSIIMPAYNAEAYIGEAIASVLAQSWKNWELLIINDGSSDKTKDIIQSFNDIRIRYFEQENIGVGAARNKGLLNMKGSYFCFLDADDTLSKNSLKLRLEVFKDDSKIQFVDGRVDVLDEKMNILKRVYLPSYIGNPFHQLIKLNDSCFFGISWMIRRDTEKQYQFRTDITHSEDLLFYISLADKGIYSFTSERILCCRTRHNSAMRNLKGLEYGYKEVYKTVSALSNIKRADLSYLKRRIIRIMVLSYLRSYRFKQAARTMISLSKL